MSDTTKIQWADATFNPWIGCTKVSLGCANCYAENTTRARVLRGQGHETWGKGKQRSRTSAATWKQPLKWNASLVCPNGSVPMKGAPGGHGPYSSDAIGDCPECGAVLQRPRVFPSLCDWLDDEVPIEWLADFLKLIYDTPNLDWLLLTKRPDNFQILISQAVAIAANSCLGEDKSARLFRNWLFAWAHGAESPQNVWIGVSVEDQKRADERIPKLLQIPALIRFLSVEPLLGPVDLSFKGSTNVKFPEDFQQRKESDREEWIKSTARATYIARCANGIDWVIVGGESGAKARPCNIEWIHSVVRQCKAVAVPCFVKQIGSKATVDPCPHCGHPEESHQMGRTVGCQHGDGSEANPICGCRKMRGEIAHGFGWPMAFHPVKHPKGGDPSEWPEDLRVREFPIH